jgi:hypothetical protein
MVADRHGLIRADLSASVQSVYHPFLTIAAHLRQKTSD